MYRQVLVPDKDNHSIEMPKEFFGKKVEVIVIELSDEKPLPPKGKEVSKTDLFEAFGQGANFPSIDELRKRSWPSKW